jgi:hypothetical protein
MNYKGEIKKELVRKDNHILKYDYFVIYVLGINQS